MNILLSLHCYRRLGGGGRRCDAVERRTDIVVNIFIVRKDHVVEQTIRFAVLINMVR